jgi:hypothetical protein
MLLFYLNSIGSRENFSGGSMVDADALRFEIVDTLGLDVYRPFESNPQRKDERYLIGEEALLSIAGALIGEFLKGLLKPEALGEKTRAKLHELNSRFQSRSILESLFSDGELISLLHAAEEPVSHASEAQLLEAEKALTNSLQQFGLDEATATNKARDIRSSIVASLRAGS